MKVLFSLLKYLFIVLVVSTVVGSMFGAAIFVYFSRGLPSIITTEDYKPLTVTRVIGRGDVVVGEFFEERRYVVPLEKIPEHVQKAFIAAEDDRFFDHQGIDLQGILRAAIANFRAGRVVQGGSTITQQVAKSLLLTPERSFFRKMKEVILANRMEKNLGKKQILYLYLNQIYLGNGAYGVEAAARVYFNKEAKDLTLAEGAILAGLPQAPTKYSPLSNPKLAKQRQQYVLRRLQEDGTITQAQMEDAVKQPLRIYLPSELNEKFAPYFVEHVRKHLLEKYGKEGVYESGLTVRTPVDPVLSQLATKVVQEGLRSIDKREGYRGPIRKNKTPDEIATAIADATEYNITQKFPFKVLLPDGTHAKDPKTRLAGLKSDLDAFDEDKIYQGVVLTVDDAKKVVTVTLGAFKGEILLDRMRWAQLVKTPSSTGIDAITRPSQALQKGDLILVRLINKGTPKTPTPELALEQEPLVQGALLSMDVVTGEILSMVGGYDYKQSEFNRAIQAERQPGSVFKPIVYSAAIDKGFTAATIIQDSPIVFNAGENEKWKPENFEEKFYGDTIFRSALIRSRNIPTIKIAQDIQVPYIIDYAMRLGFPNKINADLSIALGSTSVSLLDLCKIYSIFPRGGRRLKPIFISKVIDRDGKVLEENAPTASQPPLNPNLPAPPKPVKVAGELQADIAAGTADPNRGAWTPDPTDPDRVMDPRTAYVMTHLMNEVATVGTGHEAKNLGRPAAGKTGTTSDYIDAWFMGFTPQIVTGTWVGFDTQKTIAPKATGGLIALPIWLEYMKEAVKPYPDADFAVPKGVTDERQSSQRRARSLHRGNRAGDHDRRGARRHDSQRAITRRAWQRR
jgi:penicillin-binding protein 1A